MKGDAHERRDPVWISRVSGSTAASMKGDAHERRDQVRRGARGEQRVASMKGDAHERRDLTGRPTRRPAAVCLDEGRRSRASRSRGVHEVDAQVRPR